MTLKDKTLFISGGSRGIGLEIALRVASDGANVALIAKTGEPHPRLPGTVFTAAEAIEEAGGHALPIVRDIRDEAQVESAVAAHPPLRGRPRRGGRHRHGPLRLRARVDAAGRPLRRPRLTTDASTLTRTPPC
jgi:NAD(P)-dependent dehydrogenase (short-subunit alcohol dehydrogenase family)